MQNPPPDPPVPPSKPRWNGLPGYPRKSPAMLHNFSWEDYKDMGSQVIVHWAHLNRTQNVGSITAETPEQGKLSHIYCLGIFRCTNCRLEERPKARSGTLRREQLARGCEKCDGKKEHIKCPVKCEIRQWKGGVRISNATAHTHNPPERILHVLPDEKKEFERLVTENQNATPLQFSIGTPGLTGPGKPAAKISRVYRSLPRIAAARREVIYKTVGSGKEDSFFQALHEFKTRCPDFICEQVIAGEGNVTVVCFQTSFMRSQLVQNAVVDDAVNGIATDGAHKFFRSGILITSSAFAVIRSKWGAGLFSYSNGTTASHYKIHFLALFRGIALEAKGRRLKLTDELFASVRLLYPLICILLDVNTVLRLWISATHSESDLLKPSLTSWGHVLKNLALLMSSERQLFPACGVAGTTSISLSPESAKLAM